MSLGICLLGRFTKLQSDPGRCLQKLGAWIHTECAELYPSTRQGSIDQKPCLFCSLHPAAEEIEICIPDPSQITISANTSTAGPGYHIYLCDLVHRWSEEFSIQWVAFGPEDDTTFGDEADYFFTGIRQNVYGHMEHWLRVLAGSFFDGTMDGNAKAIALCMPMSVQFEADYSAITQLGPRDLDWLRRMSMGDLDYREFFAWYDVGLDAHYYLGRALVQMWSDVRWRKPISDTESELLTRIVNSLDMAYRANPNLPFPWNDWRDLLHLLEMDIPDFVRAKASGPGGIGYRRRPVRSSLPGYWWIKTDGSFSEFEANDQGAVSAFDPPREIWFTAYSFTANDPLQTFRTMREHALSEKHELVEERGVYISVANIRKERKDGNIWYVLQAKNIATLCRSILTIVFQRAEDRHWAIDVWKTLSPPTKSDDRTY